MKNRFSFFIFFLLLYGLYDFSYAQNQTIDSLKRVVAAAKIDTARINTYNILANQFREIHPDSVMFYANKARILSEEKQYSFGVAQALLNFGNAQILKSDYQKARYYFEQSQSKFEQLLSGQSDIGKPQLQNGLAREHASLASYFPKKTIIPKPLTII